jgi:Mor family transcriptional regulator
MIVAPGAYFMIPPFSSIHNLSEKIKNNSPDQIFLEIARKYNMTPKQVYKIIKKPSKRERK